MVSETTIFTNSYVTESFPPPRSPHRLKVRFRCPRCRPLHFTRGPPAGGVGSETRGEAHTRTTRGEHTGVHRPQGCGGCERRGCKFRFPRWSSHPLRRVYLSGGALGRGGEKLREITRGQSARGVGAGGGATGAERRRSHGCGRLGRRRCGVRCAGEGYVCSREQQSTRTRHTRKHTRGPPPQSTSATRRRGTPPQDAHAHATPSAPA